MLDYSRKIAIYREPASPPPDKVLHDFGGIVVYCDYFAKAIFEKEMAVAAVWVGMSNILSSKVYHEEKTVT